MPLVGIGVALLLMFLSNISQATPTCQKTGTICVDGPSTKPISGANIYRDCWNYQDTYNCVDPAAVNACQPLIDLGCGITNSVCNPAFNATCLTYTNTYVCTDKALSTPLPTDVTLMATSYRITSDTNDASACSTMAANSTCSLFGLDVCSDATPTKNINGLDVTRDCWAWTRTYACLSDTQSTQCSQFSSNPDCKEDAGAHCVQYAPASLGGGCQIFEHTYTCTTGGGGVQTVASCDTQQFCIDGVCFNTGYKSDQDFGKAVSAMEIVRQAGMYLDPLTLTMFNGFPGHCANRLWGLSTCCNTSGGGGAMANASMMNAGGGLSSLSFGAEAVKSFATPYMYDAMFQSSSDFLVQRAISAWGAGPIDSGWSSGFGAYGFTFSYSIEAGFTFVGFDPWSFAASVAIQVVMSMLECTTDEQNLAMKRGQNLCTYVGDYCSSEDIFGGCMERSQGYCCYNSRLARILAEGGHAQLGKGYGSAQNPTCIGFTAEELQLIDFSKIDMSEFIAEIAPTIKSGAPAMVRAQQKIQSYYAP